MRWKLSHGWKPLFPLFPLSRAFKTRFLERKEKRGFVIGRYRPVGRYFDGKKNVRGREHPRHTGVLVKVDNNRLKEPKVAGLINLNSVLLLHGYLRIKTR